MGKKLKVRSTLIIAEAGVNHNGSMDFARKMIDVAVDAGADFVKFQTFTAETLVTTAAEKATYQKNLNDTGESQFDMIKKLELDRDAHMVLIRYCKEKGIRFLSTAFDHTSIDLLHELNVPLYKIPSGEITNLPYLRHIGCIGKPVIISTGMATLKEVKDALNVLEESGISKSKITVLHCNTEYPTPMEDVNLNAMLTIRDELGVLVGYSDHTLGIEIPIAAVAMGATVIEKHFTLDRTLPGPDHHASLEPNELKDMVLAIRNIERAMGDGAKKPSPSEVKNISVVRKSIVAGKQIKAGELFSEKNLLIKRPGTGISPMKWDKVLRKKSQKDFNKDDLIEI
jgi:N,N'-diacetyllegionaminate synthase